MDISTVQARTAKRLWAGEGTDGGCRSTLCAHTPSMHSSTHSGGMWHRTFDRTETGMLVQSTIVPACIVTSMASLSASIGRYEPWSYSFWWLATIVEPSQGKGNVCIDVDAAAMVTAANVERSAWAESEATAATDRDVAYPGLSVRQLQRRTPCLHPPPYGTPLLCKVGCSGCRC